MKAVIRHNHNFPERDISINLNASIHNVSFSHVNPCNCLFVKLHHFPRKEILQQLQEYESGEVGQLKSYIRIAVKKQRNSWMTWVNDRAEIYDKSIIEISEKLADVTAALKDNTGLAEEMFIQSSRDRIIDFATKAGNTDAVVSREEFNRIFKVYDKYEKFLEARELTNGEIDVAYRIIKDSYEQHMLNHTFVEDTRGYDN